MTNAAKNKTVEKRLSNLGRLDLLTAKLVDETGTEVKMTSANGGPVSYADALVNADADAAGLAVYGWRACRIVR